MFLETEELKTVNTMTFEKFVQNLFDTDENLPFVTITKKYKKKSVFLSPGQIEQNIYFISSGIVQSSIKASNKQEKIFDIAYTGQTFCSLTSFITQKPTDLTFTCITDCEIEVVSKDNFENALKTSILANKFMKFFYEQMYVQRTTKERDLFTLSGKERYLKLIKTHPQMVKELPIGKIAQYLGIHPRSLSRLRKF